MILRPEFYFYMGFVLLNITDSIKVIALKEKINLWNYEAIQPALYCNVILVAFDKNMRLNISDVKLLFIHVTVS